VSLPWAASAAALTRATVPLPPTASATALRDHAAALHTASQALAPSTVSLYTRLYTRYSAYCASNSLEPLEESSVVCWQSSLMQSGVRPSSVACYLTAIRKYIRDTTGQPLVSRTIQAVLRGAYQRAAASGQVVAHHRPLPAAAAYALLQSAERCPDLDNFVQLRHFRSFLLPSLGFSIFARANSIFNVAVEDLTCSPTQVLIVLTSLKGRSGTTHLRQLISIDASHCNGRLLPLLLRYLHARAALTAHLDPDWNLFRTETPSRRHALWQLPGDAFRSASTFCTATLRAGLSAVKLDASYTYHCVRAGAASAASVVGVPLTTIAKLGDWSVTSPTLQTSYIQVVPWSPEAHLFFGYLLPPG
jgi:hypothetical protein